MVDSETDDEQDSQSGNRINASTVSTVVAKAPLKPALKSGGTKNISNTGAIAVTSVRGVDKQVLLQPAGSLPKPSGPPPSKARA